MASTDNSIEQTILELQTRLSVAREQRNTAMTQVEEVVASNKLISDKLKSVSVEFAAYLKKYDILKEEFHALKDKFQRLEATYAELADRHRILETKSAEAHAEVRAPSQRGQKPTLAIRNK